MRRGEDVESLLRVLFVSRDEPLAELFKLKLELDGYWVTVASSATAALEEVDRRAPDIVYLDISGLSNQQVLDMHELSLHRSIKRTPIVVLSAKHEHELAEAGCHLGILENLMRVSERVPRDRGTLVGESRLWAL